MEVEGGREGGKGREGRRRRNEVVMEESSPRGAKWRAQRERERERERGDNIWRFVVIF